MGSREAGGHGGWSVRAQRGAYLTTTFPGPLVVLQENPKRRVCSPLLGGRLIPSPRFPEEEYRSIALGLSPPRPRTRDSPDG